MARSSELIKVDLAGTVRQRDEAVRQVRNNMQVAASSTDRIERLLGELSRSLLEEYARAMAERGKALT